MDRSRPGKRDSLHHHLLEAVSETANGLELRQKLLYTTPSEWWWRWCIKSLFRTPGCSAEGKRQAERQTADNPTQGHAAGGTERREMYGGREEGLGDEVPSESPPDLGHKCMHGRAYIISNCQTHVLRIWFNSLLGGHVWSSEAWNVWKCWC